MQIFQWTVDINNLLLNIVRIIFFIFNSTSAGSCRAMFISCLSSDSRILGIFLWLVIIIFISSSGPGAAGSCCTMFISCLSSYRNSRSHSLLLVTNTTRASDIDPLYEPKLLILMSNRHTPAKLHQQAWVIFVNCLYCTWCCFACSAITHKNSSQLRSFNLSICKPCELVLDNHSNLNKKNDVLIKAEETDVTIVVTNTSHFFL